MRIAVISILCASLSGCASAPPPPPTTSTKSADAVAAMGVLMLAISAKDQSSGMRKIMEVKISPAALEVLTAIVAHRTREGRWPRREELQLPAGIDDIALSESDSLDVALKSGEKVSLNCKISPDGTIALYPPFADLAEAMGKALQSRNDRTIFDVVPVR
jgi:hypothetical protein